jgi:hypothetical protein
MSEPVVSASAHPSETQLKTINFLNMSKATHVRVIALPTKGKNRKIRKAAKADPDALPLTRAQLKAMRPLRLEDNKR